MAGRLFITAEDEFAAAELLCTALGARLSEAGGFLLRRQGGAETMLPAAAAAGVEGLEGQITAEFAGERAAADNEVLRTFGVRLLREAQYYPLALLCPIGGHELPVAEFRAALGELLNSGTPCVGVLLGMKSARAVRRRFGLGARYLDYVRALHRSLKADGDTVLLRLRRGNEEKIRRAVEEWVSMV